MFPPSGTTGPPEVRNVSASHSASNQMRRGFRVTPEFLARYDRPGPRYTSYPTAPVWSDNFGPADLEAAHQEAERSASPVSIYVHIPFCESLCLFCACNSRKTSPWRFPTWTL